jgi:hypothetical protein
LKEYDGQVGLMDWNLFWTAFGAIGGTIGAIATAIAVCVALWQTKYSQKKKLKLVFTDNSKVWNQRTGESENFISLSVINIGNRKVIIDAWGIKLKDQEAIVVYVPEASSVYETMLHREMPIELDIEESAELTWSMKKFLSFLEANKDEIKDSQPITFYVRDTTGVRHYMKTKKTAGEIKKNNIGR